MTSAAVSILFGIGIYGVVHSFLASILFKAWLEKRVGAKFMTRYYRLIFNMIGVITFLPVLLLYLLPDAEVYSVPMPWSYLMRIGQLASLGLLGLSVLQTGAMDFLGFHQISGERAEETRLVTTGLYRWVRHPLYFFSILFIWLSPVMTWNWLSLSVGITAYFFVGAIFEERKLTRVFGDAYLDYKARTPMLFPWF